MVRIIWDKAVGDGLKFIVATGNYNDEKPAGKFAQCSMYIEKQSDSGTKTYYYDEASEQWGE